MTAIVKNGLTSLEDAVRKDPSVERAGSFGAKKLTPLAVIEPINAPIEASAAAE